jgi:hypothetical protein
VPAVALECGADIQFGDNRCDFTGRVEAVTLESAAAVVSSNIVRGGGGTSLLVKAPVERVTAMGNATTGNIVVNQTALESTPWAPFNVRLS